MRNGGYDRWFSVDWEDFRCRVFRKRCQKCKVSFTLLPLAVLAHSSYPREFVMAWLWAALHGTSCRSEDFLISQSVPLPEREPGVSWTVQQEDTSIRPCYQVLARWTRRFAVRAALLLPMLTSLCVVLGLDLKNVADAISELRVTRPRLSALPVALGLLQVLRRALLPDVPVDLQDSLAELVFYLARRQLPPSHGVLRASGARVQYDSLIT